MALILHIDTATEQASVSLALSGILLQERTNSRSMDHAAWIHTAIRDMLTATGDTYKLNNIDAVAIVAGPGSYTGLRVGMATAKGICYALNIPLISINTLRLMAYATKKNVLSSSVLLCPMLDARRMEVFTGLYDADLNELIAPGALILENDSFADWLDKKEIVFSGNGSAKWKEMQQHANARFSDAVYTPQDIAFLADESFNQYFFSDLAYTDPIYLKEFYSTQKK